MNYISKLQAQNQRLLDILQTQHDNMQDLREYLESSKFYQDTTVQVADILHRMTENSCRMRDVYWNGLPNHDGVDGHLSPDDIGLDIYNLL